MRNVDRIKSLEHELGRWQKKAADQERELRRLRREAEERDGAMVEVRAALDSVLATVAVAYGKHAAKGVWTFTMPAADVRDTMEHYAVSAVAGDGGYNITVRRRGEGDGAPGASRPTGPVQMVSSGDEIYSRYS